MIWKCSEVRRNEEETKNKFGNKLGTNIPPNYLGAIVFWA